MDFFSIDVSRMRNHQHHVVENLSAEDLLDWALYQITKFDIENLFPTFTQVISDGNEVEKKLMEARLRELGKLKG
jgi:hypothetical protein